MSLSSPEIELKSVTRDGSTIKSIFIVINQREREILVDRNAVDFFNREKKVPLNYFLS